MGGDHVYIRWLLRTTREERRRRRNLSGRTGTMGDEDRGTNVEDCLQEEIHACEVRDGDHTTLISLDGLVSNNCQTVDKKIFRDAETQLTFDSAIQVSSEEHAIKILDTSTVTACNKEDGEIGKGGCYDPDLAEKTRRPNPNRRY